MEATLIARIRHSQARVAKGLHNASSYRETNLSIRTGIAAFHTPVFAPPE